MNRAIVSVIVPIYDVEKHLPKCIDSIITQSYTNLEIILIDDGSPDNCGQICDEYAKKDSRIKVIHQENGGVVRARNAGLKMCTGDFLSFVDPDDWIEEPMYEKMLTKAIEGNHQIVFCDWNALHINNKKEKNSTFFNSDPKVIFREEIGIGSKMGGALWNKLISKKFYDQCNIITDPSCTIMEDKYITIQLLYNANSIGYIQESLYNYVSRADSATGIKKKNPLLLSAQNVHHIYNFLLDKNILTEYQHNFYNLVMSVKFLILNTKGLKRAKDFIPPAHKYISSYPINNKLLRVFYWVCFNAGYIGMILIEIYYKLINHNKNKQ